MSTFVDIVGQVFLWVVGFCFVVYWCIDFVMSKITKTPRLFSRMFISIRLNFLIRKAKRLGWNPVFKTNVITEGRYVIEKINRVFGIMNNTFIFEYRNGEQTASYWLRMSFESPKTTYDYFENEDITTQGSVALYRVFRENEALPKWVTLTQEVLLRSKNYNQYPTYTVILVEPKYKFASHSDMIDYVDDLLTKRILSDEVNASKTEYVRRLKDTVWFKNAS